MAQVRPPDRLLALDLETTGLDPKSDAIVAFGSVPVVERTILWGQAERAIVDDPRSLRPRNVAALAVHQVLPEEQRGALEFGRFLAQMGGRLADDVVMLAHGATIERSFLIAAATAAGVKLPPIRSVCTLTYLRGIDRLRPHLEDRLPTAAARCASLPTALGEARSLFGLPAYPDHDPLMDALGAAELYLLLSQRFPELHPRIQS